MAGNMPNPVRQTTSNFRDSGDVAVRQIDVAFAGMICGADHALVFHAFDQRRGAVIADLQAALDIAGRGFAVARHHGHGLVKQIIARSATGLVKG